MAGNTNGIWQHRIHMYQTLKNNEDKVNVLGTNHLYCNLHSIRVPFDCFHNMLLW